MQAEQMMLRSASVLASVPLLRYGFAAFWRTAMESWTLHGREFANCNCSYGCPCQFNALPTYGKCWAVVGIQIDRGNHGDTSLDGLKVAGIFKYPGAIHMGNGEALPIVDQRADARQREALLRIMSGQDTRPGATMFQVFFSMLSKVHDPVFADIDFTVD